MHWLRWQWESQRELHTIKCQLWWWWRLDIRRKLQIGRPKRIEKKERFIWREKSSKKKIHLRWFIIFFGIQNIKRPNHPHCIALFSHFYLLCLKSAHLCGSLSVNMFTQERECELNIYRQINGQTAFSTSCNQRKQAEKQIFH